MRSATWSSTRQAVAPCLAAFVASCSLYVESLEAFQAGMAAHGKAIMSDVPNYTNLKPQIEVTEVVVG